MTLPTQKNLPIWQLTQIFDSTTTSYKYLLFKALLECAKKGQFEINFSDLAIRSIAQAWYSIHYYKLSYGYADGMSKWISEIHHGLEKNLIVSDLHLDRMYEALSEIYENGGELKLPIVKYISEFSRYVPYRLLNPFMGDALVGIPDHQKNNLIIKHSTQSDFKALYSIVKRSDDLNLKIHPEWADYLQKNMAIVEGWWRENFIHYLQKNNPTVLSLITKLDPPLERNMKEIKKEFKLFFNFFPDKRKCIYSGLILDSVSHDHYYPWSFLGNDPIYNFAPAEKSVNSSKNDKIPHHDYLQAFSEFQYTFFNFLTQKESKATEHYLNDLKVSSGATKSAFINSIESFYEPLYLTAKNQGFVTNWKYRNA